MSRKKNIAAAGAHLWVALAVVTLAGCASVPSSSPEETSTTLSGPADMPVIGCNAASLRQSVLQRLNQARAAGGMCGDAKQPAAKALVWQPALAAVASRRAGEMAQRGTFGAADARGMDQRLRQEGYKAVAVQENSAAGDYTSDTVAQTWLAHQHQCQVLTSPAYTDVGAGCANAPGTEWGHYWTVVVAKPGEGGGKAAPAKAKDKAATAKAAPKGKAKATPKASSASKAGARKCTTAACKAAPAVR